MNIFGFRHDLYPTAVSPLSFDLSLCVNCHGVRLAADAFQHHASDIFKIHEL